MSHEVHHCLRMAGPSWGRTHGEALVREGLAGRFTQLLFDNEPEPWELALDIAALAKHLPSDAMLGATDYRHDAWFSGARSEGPPRWYGYTLGYVLVGAWAKAAAPLSVERWINVPASEVLAEGLRPLRPA